LATINSNFHEFLIPRRPRCLLSSFILVLAMPCD
jgi:hypothetical protein